MIKNAKFLAISALVAGATLFQTGCLGAFFDGFFNSGWPTNNRWINLGIDILKEEIGG